jgi:hypothetical protein
MVTLIRATPPYNILAPGKDRQRDHPPPLRSSVSLLLAGVPKYGTIASPPTPPLINFFLHGRTRSFVVDISRYLTAS